jgi:sigma-B regulation protein RsbU (phosphoserine phosphatase)
VGDVSGKGVGAGLIMAIARSYFRPLARAYDSPRRVLAEVNRLLYNDTNREIFMSAVYLRWDGGARRLVYSGAGQEHLLILRAKGGGVEAVPAGGVALALVEEAEEYLEDRELPLAPGDAIVLYSDGVTEARNLENRFFGLERLTALLREVGPGAGAREIVERIVAAVKAFQASGEQHDDITVVALKRR